LEVKVHCRLNKGGRCLSFCIKSQVTCLADNSSDSSRLCEDYVVRRARRKLPGWTAVLHKIHHLRGLSGLRGGLRGSELADELRCCVGLLSGLILVQSVELALRCVGARLESAGGLVG
jgi:hypothetical protein